jgi:hypothetical protein
MFPSVSALHKPCKHPVVQPTIDIPISGIVQTIQIGDSSAQYLGNCLYTQNQGESYLL